MKTRIWLIEEGQDLEYLDIDQITGKILRVSPWCSAAVAAIYEGNYISPSSVKESECLLIKDMRCGEEFTCPYPVLYTEAL